MSADELVAIDLDAGVDDVGKEFAAALQEGDFPALKEGGEATQLEGSASVAIDLDAGNDAPEEAATCECSKCKLKKPVEGKAVARPSFVCNQCNTKRSTLSQLFGHWPIRLFSCLPEQQQIAFWQSEAKGKENIQNALVEEVADYRHEEDKKIVGGTYLPLSVLKTRGFDIEQIKKYCVDTEEHAVLGTTYNLNLKTVTKEDVTRKVWKDIFKYTSGGEGETTAVSKKKKKGGKKSRKQSGESSSSSSSSSASSSSEKPTPAQMRRLEVQKRKEQAAAAREAQKAQKAAEAARKKAQAAAAKSAAEEAKKAHKDKIAAQAAYTSLFNAHAQLVADMAVVPFDLHTDDVYVDCQEMVNSGEELMNQCLEQMKNKEPLDGKEIKTYVAGLKKITMDIKKLSKKRPRT